MSAAPELEIGGLTKRFGDTVAVERVSLAVAQGEFVSLLGPSGCGKTTTLRMIAGFVLPDEGRVRLRGRDITDAPSYRRDVGLVFQNYALFPHMTVRGNVGFGPRMRGRSRREIAERVRWALDLVQLSAMEDRRPSELSGGQQQRVAIARVLAAGASILLLDEPFSNLDARLRTRMQEEVRELQLRLGMATVHVTHDQDEAMAMSDRIVIMNAGRVEQIGTPEAVYAGPETVFVAEFMGRCNRLEGTLTRVSTGWALALGEAGSIPIGAPPGATPGAQHRIFIRPEHIRLAPAGSSAADGILRGEVERVVYLGARSTAHVRLGSGLPLLVHLPNRPAADHGWRPSGAVDVLPLPGAIMTLPS
ncbi:MAG: ABC transporter ATP-binding protein [Acetobacteraceae bacterium]|nr:ABC transporter ATP-binding protein [Acetobacteraceae bacterium]